MNLTLPKPIAEGRTAEIHEWADGHILKLYRDWCPPHWVEEEARVARAIMAAGIPSPAVGEIIEVNGRRGLVYERITGLSMLRDLNTHPWMFPKHARQLARLHVQINQLQIPGLQSYKDGLMNAIQHTSHLSERLREKALKILSTLEEGDEVCHGDFHPGNVLLAEKGPIVIDWMTARRGNRWADVARTNLLLTIGAKSAGKQVHTALKLLIRLYGQLYIKHYRKQIPDLHNELAQWMPVIAAARLNEDIAPERDVLIKMVEEYQS